jgi:hypothetical protein
MMAPPVSYLESTVPAATCEMAVSVESVAALVLLWSASCAGFNWPQMPDVFRWNENPVRLLLLLQGAAGLSL